MYYFNKIIWFLFLVIISLAWSSPSNTEFRSTWVITWDHINRYENSGQNLYRLRKIMDDPVGQKRNRRYLAPHSCIFFVYVMMGIFR